MHQLGILFNFHFPIFCCSETMCFLFDASAVNYCSEDQTCAMFYQKKSSATNQGEEFYFCNENAEIKSDGTHDHLHVKCKI